MKRSAVPIQRLSARYPPPFRRCYSDLSVSAQPPLNPSPRLRFAPSPTGHLHLGGLRTALFNHLLARKWKGKWILRIEDTDRVRLVDGAVDALRDTLDWAGLDYDEGVGIGGSHGPYTQSERLDLYQQYAQELLSNGQAYECFCTPTDLHAIRSSLLKQGSRQGYDGRCRHLTEEEVGRRKKLGHEHVIRFKSSEMAPLSSAAASTAETGPSESSLPPDLIFGDAQPGMVSTAGDDFIIIKSDGWPTYHLASVVDDHAMGITHVLRGEEWLPSVPKHHQLYNAFKWSPPLFGHLPLLVNADGTKLSKRTGDVRVEHYRDEGYEPDALLNFLALMGWDHHTALEHLLATPSTPSSGPGSSSLLPHIRTDHNSLHELFTPSQLIRAFDIQHINHRKAAVNLSKLEFLNKMTLRRKAERLGNDGIMLHSLEVASGTDNVGDHKERKELLDRFQRSLQKQKVLAGCELINDLAYIEKVFDAELPRTVRLVDMSKYSIFFFLDPQYSNHEAERLLSGMNQETYVESVEAVIADLERRLAASRPRGSIKDDNVSEDTVWDSINSIITRYKYRNKAALTTPMRHALTGRKAGPSLPTIMSVLGAERGLGRLRAGVAYVRSGGW